MRILFLSRWYPYPPDNGSKIRIFNLIKYLSTVNEVDLISFTEEKLSAERISAMERLCRRVNTVPYQPFRGSSLKSMLGYFSMNPRSTLDTFSPEMKWQVDQAVELHGYDVVIASQIDMATYSGHLRGVAKIFEEIELTNLYEQPHQQTRLYKRTMKKLTWWKYARYARGLIGAHDCCTVVSEIEKKRVQEIAPGYQEVYLIPNGVDLDHYQGEFGLPEANRLIYSGALTYSANFDAVSFFLQEIFPIILEKQPQIKLYITGKVDGALLERLPKMDQVVFTGYVEDIRPWIAQSWASIVPLRVGGGTRIKILESLALGTPVVTTSKGVEGLNLKPGRDLLVADAPKSFAAEVLQLMQDRSMRQALAKAGRAAIERQYDWKGIGRQYHRLLEKVSAGI